MMINITKLKQNNCQMTSQTYQSHENQISFEWNTEKIEEYTQKCYDIEATAQFLDEKTHISTILH